MVYLGPATCRKKKPPEVSTHSERMMWKVNVPVGGRTRSSSVPVPPALTWIINFPPVGQVHLSALRGVKNSSTGLAQSPNETYSSCITDVCKHIRSIATGPRPGSLFEGSLRSDKRRRKPNGKRLLSGSAILLRPHPHSRCKNLANLNVFLYCVRSVFPSMRTPCARNLQA